MSRRQVDRVQRSPVEFVRPRGNERRDPASETAKRELFKADLTSSFVQVLHKTAPQPGGDYAHMEMAANVSLGWPLALVGAKLTTCLTETFAAVPQKRPRTSEKGALVKPIEARLVCAKVVE